MSRDRAQPRVNRLGERTADVGLNPDTLLEWLSSDRPHCHGNNYIHLKYMQNGKEIEHNTAFDKVLFPIRSPSPSPSEGSPTHLLSHVLRACTALSKHGVGVKPPF